MDIKLTIEQENAVDIIHSRLVKGEPVTTFQAPAGCGKTVTTSFLVNSMNHLNFANATFTGAAAKNLTDKGAFATTIHRLIYTPVIRNGIIVNFRKKSRRDLLEQGIDCIVIDEYSMVSADIMNDLESYGIPLILVGDIDQLPPISNPNKYIYTTHAKLDTVMRQALESDILRLATELRVNGTKPLKGVYKDIGVFGKHELQDSWLRPDVPIIVGKNETRKQMNLKVAGDTNPKIGDKIMILKNNYDIGVVNGQTAIIKNLRHMFGTTYIVDFEDEYTKDRYTDIPMIWGDIQQNARFQRGSIYATHGYSSTCHKFQGQTLNKVLIFDESYIMREEDLKRKWLYTALTRAKEKGILLY